MSHEEIQKKFLPLGSRGRKYLAIELGSPVESYFRPQKLKHLSYARVLHAIGLTRFLVSAQVWAAKHRDFELTQLRICYDLVQEPAFVDITNTGKTEVIPDAYLLFRKLRNGEHEHNYPLLIEWDRGMEHSRKFLRHIHSRLEFIKKGGEYSRLFKTPAVTVAYITTGERPEYRESRRRAMCAWTNDLLKQLGKSTWAPLFKFCSVRLEEIYETPFFEAPIWHRPDSPNPVTLFTP